MSKYEGRDIYCYENTNVLINRFDLHDEKELEKKERRITTIKTIDLYNNLNQNDFKIDLKFYKNIHKILFEDIYSFAGIFRHIPLIKGNTRFCEPQYIAKNLKDLFLKLKKEDFSNIKKIELAEKIAYYYAELNAIHPFREGNGRVNRIFIDLLAKKYGYVVDMQTWNKKKQIDAMVDSMSGEYGKLNKLIMSSLKINK